MGAIESFGCGPSQSAAGWSFAQAGGAYNWLFVAVGGANMCKCLFLVEARRKDYDAEQPRVPAFFFCFVFCGEEEMKVSLSFCRRKSFCVLVICK